MTRPPHDSRSSTPPVGLVLILVGLAATATSRALDGFVGGVVIGLGVALLLIGVYTLSASRWSAQDPERDGTRLAAQPGLPPVSPEAGPEAGPGAGPEADPEADPDLAESIGRLILGPEPDDAVSVDHLALVRRTARAEHLARDLLADAVRSARGGGHSWGAIGVALGISRQAAQQRFAEAPGPSGAEPTGSQTRWLGPVTAFDEMAELDLAGRMGWHTVAAGLLRHRMTRTDTQWEHRRVLWTRTTPHYEQDGWVVGCRAFPWLYLVRDLGRPVEPEDAGADAGADRADRADRAQV